MSVTLKVYFSIQKVISLHGLLSKMSHLLGYLIYFCIWRIICPILVPCLEAYFMTKYTSLYSEKIQLGLWRPAVKNKICVQLVL